MKKRRIILSAIILSILLLGFAACAKSSALPERDATENDRAYVKTHAVYNGSFKSELTEDQLVIYNAFEQHYIMERSLEPFEIDVSKMCFLENEPYVDTVFENVLNAFKHDFPEAYWIETDYLRVKFECNGSYVSKAIIQPEENYNGALSEWETIQNDIESSVNEILALRKTESRYDTVKAIHDYICDKASYINEEEDLDSDQENQAHCIAPFFGGGSIGRRFVCEGYALTFKLLCDRFNIPAAAVYSRNHVYNYVQMDDGCYYAVDCTWDDGQTEGWKKTDFFYNEMHYRYFLMGEKTVLNSYIDGSQNPVVVRFNSDLEHVEYPYTYYHDTKYNLPLVYPTVSEQAYSCLEWLDESDTEISGTVSLRFRYKGNDFAGKKANIYIENKLIGTFDMDENGCFGTSYDTTLLYNGYNSIKATVGNTSVERYLLVQNPQFEILNWGDVIPAISEPFEVQVKGYSTGAITDCKIEVRLDSFLTSFGFQNQYVRYGTYSFNRDGMASFVIDPQKCDEGLHRVTVIFHKPGSIAYLDAERCCESRSFRISHSAADSGKLRFWGNSAKKDRYVGEWADFILKYDGSVTEKCQFKVTIDDAPVTPIRQGGDKVTDFFDKDGFCAFYLDVTGQSNGKHTVNALLIKEDGSTVAATNTVYITDGTFNFKIGKSHELGIDSATCMQLENISGFSGNKCRFAFCAADKLLCDRMLTDMPGILGEAWMRYGGFGDENHYSVNLSSEDGKYGDNVMKVVFSTPDGMTVEKNLPFQLEPTAIDDNFYFYSPASVRNVGKNVDFTLYYDSAYPECKDLAFTLDGQSVDVQIPDNPTSAFGRLGRFFFTLDLSDLPEGKHVIQAELTKPDGAVMTAEQSIYLTADDYFELTDWKEETPVLHRVAEIKVKNLTEDLTVASTVRQYIDGEEMGAVPFDENGLATLSLNTAGLEKGEHWYKLIFRNSDNVVAERLMRFRVE